MKITTIIFLLVVAWQIVSYLIQQAAKKKAEEQAMARRRLQQAQAAADGGQGAMAPMAGQGVQAQNRDPAAEALEIRRQAQLQQLRNRRELRQGIKPATQVVRQPSSVVGEQAHRSANNPKPVSVPSRQSAPQPAAETPRAVVQARKPDRTQTKKAQTDTARRSADDLRRIQGQSARVQQEARKTTAIRTESVAGTASARDPIRASSLLNPQGALAAASRAAGYITSMHNPKALREAIVLREVLDVPLALRPDGHSLA